MFEVVDYDALGVVNSMRAGMENMSAHLCQVGRGITVGNKVFSDQFDLSCLKSDGSYLKSIVTRTFFPECYEELLSFQRYLLKNFMCYVEVPSYRMKDGNSVASYDKFLATSSYQVISEWLGISLEEAQSIYYKQLSLVENDSNWGDDSSLYPYVKLGSGKNGRTITKPRSLLDLFKKGLRVVPVFALKAYVDKLYELGSESPVRVTFKKDDGNIRVMDTVFNYETMLDLYKGDSGFVGGVFESSYGGDFLGSNVISRGYIRVAELGASRHDSGLRAISYTRIGKVEVGITPDLRFIDVRLDEVVLDFTNSVNRLPASEFSSLVGALELSGFGVESLKGVPNVDNFMLSSWASVQETILSTSFQRSLSDFMSSNPQWFKNDSTVDVAVPEFTGTSNMVDLDDFL